MYVIFQNKTCTFAYANCKKDWITYFSKAHLTHNLNVGFPAIEKKRKEFKKLN